MGWKGAVRSMAAAARRAEREAIRRQRELERQQKEIEKMEELARAALEVELYENRIEVLLSIHKDCSDDWNWEQIATAQEPIKPSKSDRHESNAQARLKSFKPGVTDKLLGRTTKKIDELRHEVERAKRSDEKAFTDAMETYNDSRELRDLASRIIAGDTVAYEEAIKQINPFSEISEIGSSLSLDVESRDKIDVTLKVNSDDVIPSEVKSLLQSGKLSVKKMPNSHFYELYQDYICSCVLRVARESFALLSLKIAVITAVGKILNRSTGYLEDQPILSVAIPRDTLATLNIDLIDPSDSLQNFVHRMSFKKTQGFGVVKKIESSELMPSH